MSFPSIETARLRLRPWCEDDLDALHRLWVEPEVRRYLWDDVVITPERARQTLREALESVRRHGFGQWALIPAGAPGAPLIGFCGFLLRDETGDVEILYGLSHAHWGLGLATEAARAALRCGFENLGFARVVAATDPPNVRSIRVMERLGMRLERRGTLRGLETLFYAVTCDELMPSEAPYRRLDTEPPGRPSVRVPIDCREMKDGEHVAVCDLVGRVFGRDVAPHYCQEGVETFLAYVSPDVLLDRLRRNHFLLVAAIGDVLVGVIEVRNNSHVSMLFVDAAHQRKGVGKTLLRRAVEICREHLPDLRSITVNSSPNAVAAYERFGFRPQGPFQISNGIGFVPMAMEVATTDARL